MNDKLNHLVIFQNEMLATMNPIRPKTGHYRNEAVLVDQKKIMDHEHLMRTGQCVSNFVLSKHYLGRKASQDTQMQGMLIEHNAEESSLSPRHSHLSALDFTSLNNSKMTQGNQFNSQLNVKSLIKDMSKMGNSRLSSTSQLQRANPFCERPNTGMQKYSDTHPYYHEYRRQKHKDMDAKNKKLKMKNFESMIDIIPQKRTSDSRNQLLHHRKNFQKQTLLLKQN